MPAEVWDAWDAVTARPWFLLEEVEGVEYLHARGKKFEVLGRVA